MAIETYARPRPCFALLSGLASVLAIALLLGQATPPLPPLYNDTCNVARSLA